MIVLASQLCGNHCRLHRITVFDGAAGYRFTVVCLKIESFRADGMASSAQEMSQGILKSIVMALECAEYGRARE